MRGADDLDRRYEGEVGDGAIARREVDQVTPRGDLVRVGVRVRARVGVRVRVRARVRVRVRVRARG